MVPVEVDEDEDEDEDEVVELVVDEVSVLILSGREKRRGEGRRR